MVIDVNEKNINDVLEKKEGIVLQFSAEWCGPCKQITPIIAKLSSEYEDITFGKINVDVAGGIATNYGIRSIPTVLFIKNGQLIDKLNGLKSSDELSEKIAKLIN